MLLKRNVNRKVTIGNSILHLRREGCIVKDVGAMEPKVQRRDAIPR